MNKWNKTTLAEIADIRVSNVDKKSYWGEKSIKLCNYMDVYSNNYITNGINFMEATANIMEVAKFTISKGDVLITKDSETPFDIGIPSVVLEDIDNLICGYHLAQLRPDEKKVDSVFLAKTLAMPDVSSYFSRVSAGSTRYGLTNRAIGNASISLPPLEIQKKISEILQVIDRTIDKTKELIGKYQKVKTGMMHDLFTRGIDNNGELRPAREFCPSLYKETHIGWIPANWCVKKIGDVFNIQLGKMLSRASKSGVNEFPYLGNKDVQWGKIEVGNLQTMNFNPLEREKFKLISGDILVCEGGDVGRTAIWNNELNQCFYQKAIHRLRTINNEVLPGYMQRFMLYAKNNGFLNHCISQTSIAHLTQEKLSEIYIFYPKTTEQAMLVERFNSIDKKIESELLILEILKKKRNGLMFDLLTGKVPVQSKGTEASHV